MLSTQLDQETEVYLADILASEEISREELIKNLIRDRWNELQAEASSTRLDDLSEAEEEFRPAASALAKRKNNKQMISDYLNKKKRSR